MFIIDQKGYISKQTIGKKGSTKNGFHPHYFRNWFLIKYYTAIKGKIQLGIIQTPPHLIGRRVRLKVEVIPDLQNKRFENMTEELLQETRESEMDSWIDMNRSSLVDEFVELMQDDFNVYCKEQFFKQGE